MTTTVRRFALVAWIVFGVLTAGAMLAGFVFPAWLCLILLFLAILVWSALLAMYRCWLAHWRSVLLCWLVFGLLRGAATWLGSGDSVLGGVVASLLAPLYLYAWLAGCAALIALVWHRDVSVAYVFIPTAIGALVMLMTVQAAGGVSQWFDALMSVTTVGRSLVLEPLLLSLSCMGTLGFIALVPHMMITLIREIRGN